MRRGLATLIILFLLISPTIISAQEDTSTPKEQLSALRGGLNEETEDILERKLDFPKVLNTPLKVIFKIEEDGTWQELIIILTIFIGFFILILNITELLPFIDKGLIKVLTSLIITTLVSITGALSITARVFIDIAGFFEWTGSWKPLRIIIAILIISIIIFIVSWYIKKAKVKIKLKSAKRIGEETQVVATLNKKKIELNQ